MNKWQQHEGFFNNMNQCDVKADYPRSVALYSIFPTVSCCEDVDLQAALRVALSTYIVDMETNKLIKDSTLQRN